MAQQKTIFVATCGGQPQIVTFALDQLLAEGEAIEMVHLVYLQPRSDRLKKAMGKLLDVLRSEPRYTHLKVVKHPIYINRTHVTDVINSEDAALVWEFINQLITSLKQSGYRMHLCISGGRRILGMLMMSAASVHFYPNDKIWHMFTPDQIQAKAREGAMMHLPPDSGFQLVEVPMLPLGTIFVSMRNINHFNQKRAFLDSQQEERCLEVIETLTSRQKDVLEQFALGLTPDEVSEKLVISIHTVDSHKRRIFEKCRDAWDLPEDNRLTYHFLADQFEPFF